MILPADLWPDEILKSDYNEASTQTDEKFSLFRIPMALFVAHFQFIRYTLP